MALVSDYTGLITSQHANKPRFMATVAVVVAPFVDMINAVEGFSGDYDLDNAVGVQLDAIGLWVGVSRNVAISVDAYFSFDTLGVGFDQGIWFQTGDSTAIVTSLDDGHYRLLIRAKIGCNNWDGSLPVAYQILQDLVSQDNCTVLVSEGNRSVVWRIIGNISAVTQALLTGGYVPLKPVGINVNYTFTVS